MVINVKLPPVQTQYFPFMGGLDEVTPPISRSDGDLRYGVNLEIGVRGGYATCAGYERYDGRARPSAANYALLGVALTGAVNIGDVVTNSTATVYGTVIAIPSAASLVITNTTGLFAAGQLKVGATVVGNSLGVQLVGAASTVALNAAYSALAANVYRALVQKVPGSGRILGVHQYNGNVYAFRNTADGSTAAMYKDSPSGWVPVNLGTYLQFRPAIWPTNMRFLTVAQTIGGFNVQTVLYNQTITVDQEIKFTVVPDGALPFPSVVTAGVTYYVVGVDNTQVDGTALKISATKGGTPIASPSVESIAVGTITSKEIMVGDTITSSTSGATAIVKKILLNAGTWGDRPYGTIILDSVVGNFDGAKEFTPRNVESLSVNGTLRVFTASTNIAASFMPNGRFEFENWNFGGQSGTMKMYGIDGVNPGFEFDGSFFIPIASRVTPDAPKAMQIHKNALFYAFGASVQYTGPGNPYAFSAIYGAGEIACGDDITDMLSLPGSETSGAMAIKTKNRTFVLYGNSEDDFNLVPYSYEAGCEAHTLQLIAGAMSFDTQGLSVLSTTQKYGNFLSGIVSDKITPFLNGKVGLAAASCIVRKKNQYRIFFTDGDAVFVTFAGDKLLGMTTMNFPHDVTCISSLEGASGREEIYFGSSDGYVRQAESGTSFDGQPINWLGYLTYNHFKGPRQLKTYRKAALEVTGLGYAEFVMSSSLGYGSTEFAQSVDQTLSTILASSVWDSFVWDSFVWDGQTLLPAEGDLYGTAENISLVVRGSSDAFQQITLNSAIIHYTQRRLLR